MFIRVLPKNSKLKPDSWVLLVSLIPTLARCLLLAKVQIWSFFCRPDSLWASMGPNLLAGTCFCFCDVFWLWTCSSCRCCSGCSSSGCTGIPFAFCSSCAASSRLLVDRFCFYTVLCGCYALVVVVIAAALVGLAAVAIFFAFSRSSGFICFQYLQSILLVLHDVLLVGGLEHFLVSHILGC